MGEYWAAYSPASGETHLLNNESAAILEWLLEQPPASSADTQQAAAVFAVDAGVPLAQLAQTIELGWIPLRVAGLVRPVRVEERPA